MDCYCLTFLRSAKSHFISTAAHRNHLELDISSIAPRSWRISVWKPHKLHEIQWKQQPAKKQKVFPNCPQTGWISVNVTYKKGRVSFQVSRVINNTINHTMCLMVLMWCLVNGCPWSCDDHETLWKMLHQTKYWQFLTCLQTHITLSALVADGLRHMPYTRKVPGLSPARGLCSSQCLCHQLSDKGKKTLKNNVKTTTHDCFSNQGTHLHFFLWERLRPDICMPAFNLHMYVATCDSTTKPFKYHNLKKNEAN